MEQRKICPALFARPSWALGRFSDWPSEVERFFDDFARRRWPASFNGNEAQPLYRRRRDGRCNRRDSGIARVRGERRRYQCHRTNHYDPWQEEVREKTKGKNWQMSERSYGSFSRPNSARFQRRPRQG